MTTPIPMMLDTKDTETAFPPQAVSPYAAISPDAAISPYMAERATMDSTYFPSYADRQLVHDDLISRLLSHEDPLPTSPLHHEQHKTKESKFKENAAVGHRHPWLIYTCGTYGSGKSHCVRYFRYYKPNFIWIDPDRIKTELGFLNSKDPVVIKAQHLEATYVALLAEKVVIRQKRSAFIDGSLHDHAWYKPYFEELKLKHPQYQLGMIRVSCKLSIALTRCVARGIETKRVIPEDVVTQIHQKMPQSFDILSSYMDCIVELNNDVTPRVTRWVFNLRHQNNELLPRVPPFLHFS